VKINGGNHVPDQEKVSPIQIEKYLKGADYPTSKTQLVELARQNGAPSNVISKIQHLPGERFQTTKDVVRAVGATE